MGKMFVGFFVYFARGPEIIPADTAAFVLGEMFFDFEVADVCDEILDQP